MSDPYSILGVSRNATPEEIKSAYRTKAKVYHPDNQETGDLEKFKELSNAFSTLTDPQQQQQHGHHQWGGHHFNMDDLIAQQFEEMFRRARRANRDVSGILELTLEQTFTGHEVEVNTTNDPNGPVYRVKVPRSIHHDQKIRIEGGGRRDDPNLPPGDFYIVIAVHPHPRFRRHHDALVIDLEIDALEAILGTTQEVTGIDGQKIVIEIPAGTQFGDTIRVEGHGFYLANSESRGPLYINAAVKVPTTLGEKHRELVQRLQEMLPIGARLD